MSFEYFRGVLSKPNNIVPNYNEIPEDNLNFGGNQSRDIPFEPLFAAACAVSASTVLTSRLSYQGCAMLSRQIGVFFMCLLPVEGLISLAHTPVLATLTSSG